MKKEIFLIIMCIVLVSSVFALYTGENDSETEGEMRITSDDYEEEVNKTKEEYEKRTEEEYEKAKRTIEQRRDEVKNRIQKGIENSDLPKEEKQRIMNQIQERINQSENMMEIKSQQAKNLTNEEKRELFQKRNRLKTRENNEEECPTECYCAGSTTRCWNQEGRELTINSGNSGNTIVKTQDSNMSTNVTLYHHDGRVFGNYKENKTIAINHLPDDVDDKVKQRINARNEERKIELDENDGNYSVEAKKRARLLGMIPVKEKIQMKMNPETGEVLREKNSWWGFLARDVKE